jgi:hypothetical protein
MKWTATLPLRFVAFALSLLPLHAGVEPGLRAETIRTVYFSAIDAKGEPVIDLRASDVLVKENGKPWAIASLGPATGPFQVSILVDDGGSGSFQAGVARFINGTLGRAEYAISMLNPQPFKLTDFTTDEGVLRTALAGLVQRGRIQQDGEQLIEAVSWAAKQLQKRKAARPVIVAITNGGEPMASEARDAILSELKDSGASLNVVFINGISFGKVLGEGPKLSGGLLQNAVSNRAIEDALSRVAANLLHQYVLTYVLPNGTKPNDRFQLTTTRKGVTLIAPERIPEK